MLPHDPSLVILSMTIAILGGFTASVLTSGVLSLDPSEARLRIIMAIIALGGSIWATHFVGLLAIQAPINWSWNPGLIAASGLAAIISSSVSLLLVDKSGLSAPRFPIAVLVLGFGIAATHYFGLLGITGSSLSLSWFLVLIAIAIAVQVAGLGLWFLFKPRRVVVTFFGAVALGLGLAATHYAVIASANDLEQTLRALPPDLTGLSERYLAWSATIMMYLICSICLCIFVIMQFREEIR